MEEKDIHVGDVLRIRSYEDMVDEYGCDKYGIIYSENSCFSEGMSYLCGEQFTVSEITNDAWVNETFFLSKEGIEYFDSDGWHWYISAWMLEPYDDTDSLECATDDEIMLLFL